MCSMKRSKKTSSIIESIIFIAVIAIILVLFSIPIVLNYTIVNDLEPIIFEPENSTSFPNSTVGSQVDCSTLSWGQSNDGVTDCIKYTGTFCKSLLSQWHHCTIGGGEGNVFVNVSVSLQTQREIELNQLNIFLNSHKECQKFAVPFLCQYYYPLSDCSTSTGYTASKEDCIDISTGICADLWQLAIAFGYGSSLPDCNNLPNIAFTSNGSVSNNTLRNNTTNSTVLLPCKDDFIRIDSFCEPRCDSFMQWSKTGSLFIVYTEIIASAVCLVLSITVLILSIRHHKTMLKYPSIFVVFQAINFTVLSLLLITVAIGRNSLFCSSVSLLKTLENPTPFCKISGAIFHYSFMNNLLWWFCNVVVFFHKVIFPFQANRFEKLNRNKFIFATIVAIAILVPTPAVVIPLAVEKFSYYQGRFPATVCLTHKDIWFYSVILPYDVLLAIGLCLLIAVLWSIRKKSNIFSKKRSTQISLAEKKIAVVFLSFLVLGIFILCLNRYLKAKELEFRSALTEYFTCEAFGHEEGKCDRNTFTKVYSSVMLATLYILMSLIPLSILNFVLKWKSVKKAGTSMRRIARKGTLLLRESSTASESLESNQVVQSSE